MNDDFLDAILANSIAAIATCFSDNERALDYAKESLGLNDEQATKQQLGFADRTLGKQIPQRRIKRGREVRDALDKAGLYKAKAIQRGQVSLVSNRSD